MEYLFSGGVTLVCPATRAVVMTSARVRVVKRFVVFLMIGYAFQKQKAGTLWQTQQSHEPKELIDLLNEDLARDIRPSLRTSSIPRCSRGKYMSIAKELENHAAEELQHALKIAKHIDYLGGMPTARRSRSS